MADRETLYRMFGPKLFEAFGRLVRDEINLLRAQHGLPPRTNQQIMDALENELQNIPPYTWEVNDPVLPP